MSVSKTNIKYLPELTADINESLIKQWESLGIDNDFIFCKVMQVLNKYNLPKRIRYYRSMSDAEMLDKGVDYEKLGDSYVIMICPFDLFNMGLHKYSFTYRCKESLDLELMDGTKTIILNAVGTADDVDKRLRAFLDYVVGKMSDDGYVRRVNMAVEEAKMDSALRRDYLIRMQNQLQSDKRARAEGQTELVEAIRMFKDGKTQEDLQAAGIAQDTIDLALTCL